MLNRTQSALLSLTTLAALGLAATQPAHAQISGFGSGFVLNHGGDATHTGDSNDSGSPASISGNVLTITTAANSEANSAVYSTKQGITSFTASFTYTDLSGGGGANGATFFLENDSLGTGALGGRGSGMGYGSDDSPGRTHNYIGNSAAVALNVYSYTGGPSVGTTFLTAGSTGTMVGSTFTPTGTVNLASTDPIKVTLAYSGTTLSETFTDTTTLASYNTSVTNLNLASVVGGNTAYVGFSGGTGGYNINQTISNFTFAAAPEPSQYAGLGLGVLGVAGLAFKARKRRVAA